MTRARLLRLAREVLLTSTAALGAVCLLVTLAGLALDVRPLMFRSGSMSPTIDTGDLSLSRTVDAADLHRGDIVSVIAANGERVTHRVVTVTGSGTTRQLTLKGDANDVVDNQVYDVKDAQRVLFTIPRAGYVVNWFSHTPGAYVLALYLGLMLMLVFRRPAAPASPGDVERTSAPEPEPDPKEPVQRRVHGRRPLRALALGAGLVGALVALSGWSLPTWAYWTDSSAVSGTTFTTRSWAVPAAPVISCSKAGSNYTISWSAVSGATSYTVTWNDTSNHVSTQNVTSSPVVLNPVFGPNNGHPIFVTANNSSGSSAASNSIISC